MRWASRERTHILWFPLYTYSGEILGDGEWSVGCRGLGEGEDEELLFKGYRVSGLEENKVLDMDGGNRYTTV